ncbi:MAG: hypothetical protein HFE76_04335 [Firmicutes bacterium]|nr:hypothetical protein [Bacillota bacterium]
MIQLQIKGKTAEIQRQKPLLSEGEYVARITDVELIWDKAHSSYYLYIHYDVDQGEGQPVWLLKDRIYFSDGNEERLSTFLAEACPEARGTINEEALIGKLGIITIGIRKNGQKRDYNTVMEWNFSEADEDGEEDDIPFDEDE